MHALLLVSEIRTVAADDLLMSGYAAHRAPLRRLRARRSIKARSSRVASTVTAAKALDSCSVGRSAGEAHPHACIPLVATAAELSGPMLPSPCVAASHGYAAVPPAWAHVALLVGALGGTPFASISRGKSTMLCTAPSPRSVTVGSVLAQSSGPDKPSALHVVGGTVA